MLRSESPTLGIPFVFRGSSFFIFDFPLDRMILEETNPQRHKKTPFTKINATIQLMALTV